MVEVQICALCRFWEFNYRPRGDYAIGECKRYAPSPTSYVLTMIARFTGETAWATSDIANIELDDNIDYRAEGTEQFEINEWPLVRSCEWCGEFEKRTTPAKVDDSHPDELERHDAATVWEKEAGLNDTGPYVGGVFKNTDSEENDG
jgi:hypothetical protein